MLNILILAAALDMPPMPPGLTPKTVALSPKATELKASWGTPMAKVAVSGPLAVPTGFVITNITVQNGTVSLSWQLGQPLFQVEGEPSMLGPWNDVGSLTTARTKTFNAGINQFWRIAQSNSLPLNLNSNSQPRLTWTTPELDMSDSISKFKAWKCVDQSGFNDDPTTSAKWSVLQDNIPPSTLQLTDTTTPPVAYALRGYTANSVVIPYVTAQLSPCAPPVLTINQDQPRLTWTVPCVSPGDSVDHYTVFRTQTQQAQGADPTTSPFWANLGDVTVTSFIDTTSPAPVWYSVRAYTVLGAIIAYANQEYLPLQPGKVLFQRQFGGITQNGYLSMNTCAVDSAGNLIIAATLNGGPSGRKVDFGNGVLYEINVDINNPFAHYADAVVVKYSPDGVVRWVKQFGGVYEDSAMGVSVDSSDNVVVTGFVKGQPLHPIIADVGFGLEQTYGDPDVILVKYSSAGTVLWHKIFPGTTECSEIGAAVVVDKGHNDEILIAGTHGGGGGVNLGGGVLPTYGGTKDVFVGRLDKDGNHIWSKSWGGPGDDTVNRIAIDSSGNVIVVGRFTTPLPGQTANFGSGPISTTGGTTDGWAGMYRRSDGAALWVKQFGGDRDQNAKAVTVDASDNVYIGGDYLGTLDLGGGVILPDWGAEPGFPGPGNIFFVKYNNSGTYQRSRSFGLGFGSGVAPSVMDLGMTSGGNLILLAFLGDSVDFGTGLVKNLGSAALVLKFDVDIASTILWVRKSGYTDLAHNYIAAETPRCLVVDRAHADTFYACAEGAPNTNPSWPNGSFFENTLSIMTTQTNNCVNNENWWKFQP